MNKLKRETAYEKFNFSPPKQASMQTLATGLGGSVEDIGPFYDLLEEHSADIATVATVLGSTVNPCGGTGVYCNSPSSTASVAYSALIDAGLEPSEVLMAVDGKMYATEEAMAAMYGFLGDEHGIIEIEYTPSSPTTDARMAFKFGECDRNILDVRLAYAQKLSRAIDEALAENGETYKTPFDPYLWELIYQAILETVPDFVPGVGEALELQRSVEEYRGGNYGQGTFHLSMALAGVIGVDKIKDIAKVSSGIRRAFKVWKLVKKMEALNPAVARGMLGMVANSNKIGHIFRVADGHMPELAPLVNWAGGQENLVYLVNKNLYESGKLNNLVVKQAKKLELMVNGQLLNTTVVRLVENDVEKIIISNIWIP